MMEAGVTAPEGYILMGEPEGRRRKESLSEPLMEREE